MAIRPVGATGPRSTRGEQRLSGLINVISARERHVRIRRYERVRQRETWPGIDLVYRLSGPALEYDVVVRPGADLRRARIALDGADDLRVDADGALVARVGSQTIRQAPPVAFQGGRRLPARFVLHGDGTVSFAVTGRDPGRTLVIDPVLGVSGFLGGWVEDEITDVDLDAAGNVYVSGWTQSRDLAPFGWDEWNAMCAFDTCVDAFVAKYAPGGRSLVYLTLRLRHDARVDPERVVRGPPQRGRQRGRVGDAAGRLRLGRRRGARARRTGPAGRRRHDGVVGLPHDARGARPPLHRQRR